METNEREKYYNATIAAEDNSIDAAILASMTGINQNEICKDGLALITKVIETLRKNVETRILVISDNKMPLVNGDGAALILDQLRKSSRKPFEMDFALLTSDRISEVNKNALAIGDRNNKSAINAVINKPTEPAIIQYLMKNGMEAFLQKYPNTDPKKILSNLYKFS